MKTQKDYIGDKWQWDIFLNAISIKFYIATTTTTIKKKKEVQDVRCGVCVCVHTDKTLVLQLENTIYTNTHPSL